MMDFEKWKWEDICTKCFILTQTGCATHIIFAPKQKSTFCFYIDQKKLSALWIEILTQLPGRTNEATTWKMLPCSVHCTQTVDTGKSKLMRKAETKHNLPLTICYTTFLLYCLVCKTCRTLFKEMRTSYCHLSNGNFILAISMDDIVIFLLSASTYWLYAYVLVTARERKSNRETEKMSTLHKIFSTLDLSSDQDNLNTKKTYAIRGVKPSANQTDLPSFLGVCNWFWRFAANFARLATRINKKHRKDPWSSSTILLI